MASERYLSPCSSVKSPSTHAIVLGFQVSRYLRACRGAPAGSREWGEGRLRTLSTHCSGSRLRCTRPTGMSSKAVRWGMNPSFSPPLDVCLTRANPRSGTLPYGGVSSLPLARTSPTQRPCARYLRCRCVDPDSGSSGGHVKGGEYPPQL